MAGAERQLAEHHDLYPLSELYRGTGLPCPWCRRVPPDDLPEECRLLLVHMRGMTTTLARRYRQRIDLRVIRQAQSGDTLTRCITLRLSSNGRPVLLAGARIWLRRLSASAQKAVVAGQEPFGAILVADRVAHRCQPQEYLEVVADSFIATELGLERGERVYARRSAVMATSGVLAEVLELMAERSMGILGDG